MDDTRPRSTVQPLDPRAVVIMRRLAGEFAERYVNDYLLGHFKKIIALPELTVERTTEALADQYNALLIFFGHYAFSRRGKDRDELASLSIEATKRLVIEQPFEKVLAMPDGEILWQKFDSLCRERNRKSNEQQNRGPLQGMLELAQEIFRLNSGLSVATWVVEGIRATSRLEPQHMRIVDIRGVGPKSASTFLRDIVRLYEVEDEVDAADRLFVQPVDRWLRMIVQYVVPEPELSEPPDWVVAGKISKYTRRANVSGVRFNMGTSFYGQRVVGDPARLGIALRELVDNGGNV